MLLITTLFAAAAASTLFSLFDSEVDTQSEERGFDGSPDALSQKPTEQESDFLEQLYQSDTELAPFENDDTEQASPSSDPDATLDVPVENAGAVKFELADTSQGKTLVSRGVFVVEGALEVPSLFSDPEQVVWLYRHMTDGGVAPESDEYSGIRLAWVPPVVMNPFIEENAATIEVSGSPIWSLELDYRTG